MSLASILNNIGPKYFSRICLFFSASWLIIIYPSMIWFCPDKLPRELEPRSHCDFFQYYAGAVIVRQGIWDSLYPIPKPEIYDAPNHFIPKYQTFLFNPSTASGNPIFYPALNLPNASVYAPKLVTAFPQMAFWSYIYPPPAALYLSPLSFVSFDCAVNRLWPTICIWSLFIVSFFASRIYRFFCQTDSYIEGVVILACVIFSYRGRTDIPSGNITPVISALIAFSTYALMRKRLLAVSCAWIPLVLFKTIGLTWLPLLLINRAYWRTLSYLAIWALLLNGIVFELAGLGVYEKFFSLAPKIAVPAGVGIVPALLQNFGFYPHSLYLIINLTCLGFLYYGYWKRSIGSRFKNPADNSPLPLVALLAGTMALYCLTNFSVWLPYCPNYLFFPFLGWILYEGYLASGPWRHFILGGTGLAFLVLAGEWVIKGSLFALFGKPIVDWYSEFVFEPGCILFIPAFFLLVALRRLFSTMQSQNNLVK